jgi:hypothetical protein
LLPFVAQEREVGRNVSHLQIRLGDGFFLRCGGGAWRELPRHAQQQEQAGECRDDPFHWLLLLNLNATAGNHYSRNHPVSEELLRDFERGPHAVPDRPWPSSDFNERDGTSAMERTKTNESRI